MITIRVRSIQWFALGLALALVAAWSFSSWQADAAIDPAESSVVPVTPTRVLDSRDSIDIGLPGPFVSQISQKLQVTGLIPTTTGNATVVPAGATGVLLNVTPVRPSSDGFISVQPGDATGAPGTSNLNFTAGAANPNAVTVTLPTSGADSGTIRITYDALGVVGPTTEVLIDVVGYTTNAGLQELEDRLDATYTADEVDAGFVAHGEIVMSHGTSQLTQTNASTATITPFVTGNVISGSNQSVHLSLAGPALIGGIDYGLKSIEYCIDAQSGFITTVQVYGMQPISAVADDTTDRTVDGCYTVEVNDSTSQAYDFLLRVDSGSVRITGIQSTWAPSSTLGAPTPARVGDPLATG
jgi:hypothetical protein